jgi:hypothetical protein
LATVPFVGGGALLVEVVGLVVVVVVVVVVGVVVVVVEGMDFLTAAAVFPSIFPYSE